MIDASDMSRRDFLATAAVGLAACARGSQSTTSSDSVRADDQLLYVGTYTENTKSEGVYLLRMDRRTGKLSHVGSVSAGLNPSFLTIRPDGNTLYAVNEVDTYKGSPTGAVTAFAIARGTGALTRLNEQSSGGAAPCFISTDRGGRVALVANYDGGSVALLPIQADGSLAPPAQVVQHQGKGPVPERQATPHAHCIIADPSNRFALASDLGADRVFLYRLDVAANALSHVEGGDAVMRPGAGPRHLAFHPSRPLVFVVNEIDGSVASLRFDAERGALSQIDVRSTLPAGWTGSNDSADIHVAPSGRTLYASNRGPNSIAVFSVAESGALSLDQSISTEGDWPRNFTIDPSGGWLLVANQRSNSIVVFSRDQATGRLTRTQQRIELPSPVCLRFR
jgi:6-phosphogluconolactonase